MPEFAVAAVAFLESNVIESNLEYSDSDCMEGESISHARPMQLLYFHATSEFPAPFKHIVLELVAFIEFLVVLHTEVENGVV